MPRGRNNSAVVSKKLKQVVAGIKPERAKKLSSKRRAREARERAIRKRKEEACTQSNSTDVSSPSSSDDERRAERDGCGDVMSERDALWACKNGTIESLEVIAKLLDHTSAKVRIGALRQICPCRIWGFDDEKVWGKIFAMAEDEDLGVRKQVLHTLCDGSPAIFERDVMETVESFNSEPDKNLRRMAHKVLASYRRTGKWNIM